MAAGFIGVSWLAWGGVAAVASALFTVIQIPKQTPHTAGLTHFVLRWATPSPGFCWRSRS